MYLRFQGGAVFEDLPFKTDLSDTAPTDYSCIRGWEGEYDESDTLLLRKESVSIEGIGEVHLLIHMLPTLGGWSASLRVSTPLLIPHTLRGIICIPRNLTWRKRTNKELLFHNYVLAVHDYGLFLDVGTISGASATTVVAASKIAMEQFVPLVEEWLSRVHNAIGTVGWDFLQGRFRKEKV